MTIRKLELKSQKSENRIQKTFARLMVKGEKALITFITAGDPNLQATKDIVFALEKAGADIIELGIPFSDPMADGPTIQAASERALKKGTTLGDVLDLVRDIRKVSEIPIILFGYYNPIFIYGVKRFAKDAKDAGADGVLVVDLPPEEAQELKVHTDRNGLDLIFLLTPTSDDSRMRLVAEMASGFIYYVSVAGITGARKELSDTIQKYVKKVRQFTPLPVGVGFGISTPQQVMEVSRYADAVIVGSAIVKVIEGSYGSPGLTKRVERFVSGLKKGLKKG
ncbi:MAG: tryptophan synthase subunit alpha [Deltaproteobacteria bacterium RIFCSPLOWO2_02_44_9]|nr:MAG: tryptophan synthase subunit alpha [Deltaproteobacteria bacterium RIFCSPLOWO2_02_44_9]